MSKKNVSSIVSGAGWIGSFAGLLIEDLEEFGVSAEDIHKLGKPTKECRPLVRACAEKIAEAVNGKRSEYLRLISGGAHIIIGECDGSDIIAEATDLFVYIDSDFRNWKADEKGSATGRTPVQVYEMGKDGKFSQIFGSMSSDLGKLCLSQHQILSFIRDHRNWLRTDGYGTFFLFKSNEQFFVAGVGILSDGKLRVRVGRLEHAYVWHAGRRHRFVIPQL